jgi:hypothetical protein
MPRNQYSRKSSGRQLSKTELLIEQENKDARRAHGQQRHREYLARQQRRDNKARRVALNSSGYIPTWKLERDRQHAIAKKQTTAHVSFNVLTNEDDDERSLRRQEHQQLRAPRPVKVSAYSGGSWRNVAVKPKPNPAVKPKPAAPAVKPDKPNKPKPADKPKPSAFVPPPAPKAALTKTGWDSDSDDDDDDAWPTLETSNWADEA